MKARLKAGLLGVACVVACASADAQDIDHTEWTKILQRYVTPQSLVDYEGLKSSGTAALDRYLRQIAQPWPPMMDTAAKKAALIDAYNALAVRWIIANFPVKSIWRTDDPFRVARHRIDGRLESLDDVETRLRSMGDPRIHGALVCASISCPPLRREAYVREVIDHQLDDNVRIWLRDAARNRFRPQDRVAQISQIFQWYAEDFAKVGGVTAFLREYAPPNEFSLSNHLEYQKYNWGLNDSGSAGKSYSGTEFYWDYARNGYVLSDVENWFLGLGKRYGVNPIVFGTIYIGAIPFFSLSIAWLVRNLRNRKSAVAPLLASSFFFISAYLYLLAAGRNIPVWVYFIVAAMVGLGAWSAFRKVRARLTSAEHSR